MYRTRREELSGAGNIVRDENKRRTKNNKITNKKRNLKVTQQDARNFSNIKLEMMMTPMRMKAAVFNKSSWADDEVGGCQGWMSRWVDVKMGGCRGGRMSRWAGVKVSGCQGGRMSRWADVEVGGYQSGWMSRWADVEVSRCQGEGWRVAGEVRAACTWRQRTSLYSQVSDR